MPKLSGLGTPFGQGLPMSNGLGAVSVAPVVASHLQHAYARHAVRMRPHFEDGGDSGGSDSGSDAGYGGGQSMYGGYGVSSGGSSSDSGYGAGNAAGYGSGYGGSYGSNLGSIGVGASAGTGGYGIGGFGGAVSSVSGGSGVGGASGYGNTSVGSSSNSASAGYGGSSANSSASDSGFGGSYGASSDSGYSSNDNSGYSGYGGGFNAMNVGGAGTMGTAAASVAGLGSDNMGYGFSSGNGGNIGPSGVAMGAGYASGSYGGLGATGLAGFGNFGGDALGGTAGSYQGGLNSADSYGYGMGTAGMYGFQGLNQAVDGTLGKFSLGTGINGPTGTTGPYGDLSGVKNVGFGQASSDASSEPSFGTFGDLSGVSFSNPTQEGTSTLSDATDAAAPALTVHGQLFGGLGADIGTNTLGLSNYSSPDDVGALLSGMPVGVALSNDAVPGLKGLPGFDNFGQSDAALTKSILGDTPAGYTPPGWSPMGEVADMVKSPGDYFGADYPALAKYTGFNSLSPNFAAGLLGNFNVESNATALGPMGIRMNTVNPYSGAIGMEQALGDRKVGLMNALGINNSLTDAQKAAQMTADTFSNQLGYGLNEIATQPRFGETLSAATDPNVSAADATKTVMSNFEGPSPQEQAESIGARLGSAAAFAKNMGQSDSYGRANAGLSNLGGGSLGATSDTSDAASDPASVPSRLTGSVAADVAQAYGLAGINPNTSYSDNVGFNPAVSSGEDSMSPAAYAAAAQGWNSPSTALADAQAMDQANAAGLIGRDGAPSVSDNDTTLGIDMARPTAVASALPTANRMADAVDATRAMGLPGMTQVGLASSYDGTPIGTDTADPLTINGTPTVTSTPSYFPGEKTAVKTVANGIVGAIPGVGLANTVSGLFGGPTVGGWLADHSNPGEPANASGNNNSHDNPKTFNSTYINYGQPGQKVSQAAAASPAATKAYLAALKTLPSYPTKKANAVALVAPGKANSSYYNPLTDPLVKKALERA